LTPNKSNKRGARSQARQNKTSAVMMVDKPSQILTSITSKYRFRFQIVNTPGVLGLTRAMLLNLLQSGNSSTTTARLIAAIRVNRIQMFCSPIGAYGNTTCSVEWLSTYGPSTEKSDTTTSISIPASVISSPPRNSLASFWSLTGQNESDVIAKISFPSNSYGNALIDVWTDIVLMDDESPVTLTPHNSVTVSQLYMGYLDGFTGGSSAYQPIAYTSIQ
jgi:hypothetical protein